MKKIAILFFLSLNFHLFSAELNIDVDFVKKVNDAFNRWDVEKLDEYLGELKESSKKGYDENFLITKIYFRLAFIEYENNNRRMNSRIRNEDENEKGYLNLCGAYGEIAFSEYNPESQDEQSDLLSRQELSLYLSICNLKLIADAPTYFKYIEKVNYYTDKLKEYPEDDFFSLLYFTDFNCTFDTRAGADRKKGEALLRKIMSNHPDSPEVTNLASRIYYGNGMFDKSVEYCEKTLDMNPENLEAQKRLALLMLLGKNPLINNIVFENTGGLNEKVISLFLKIKKGQKLDLKKYADIEKNLSDFRLVSSVDVELIEEENSSVTVAISVSSNPMTIVNLSAGFNFTFLRNNQYKWNTILGGIQPVLFMSDPSLFDSGVVKFDLITAVGMLWDLDFSFNVLEKFDFKAGLETFPVPGFFTISDNAKRNVSKASINYIYLSPSIEAGKTFDKFYIDLFAYYKPKFIFVIPDFFNTTVDDRADFIMPPSFYIEHHIGVRFSADYIGLIDGGIIREGFLIKAAFEWMKKTPDTAWGYKDFLNIPTNAAFMFSLSAEYSKFIKRIVYVSLGFQYKGGINLYKDQRIEIGSGNIGTPFGYQTKVHGFKSSAYMADHLFLVNMLAGIKATRYFYFGYYLDICHFMEREAGYSIYRIGGSEFYGNLAIGSGCFYTISPMPLFFIMLEISFGYDVGATALQGPVIGIYIQKTFVIARKKKKMKVVLINLPVPDFYQKFQKGNHQVFADYVRSLINKKKLDIEVIRINRHAIDNYNDRALTDEILKHSPDAVGFSCYLWNIERNSVIASRLRENGITTIAGGPEVHKESANQETLKPFDILISGEGEFLLVEILSAIAQNKKPERYNVNRNIIDFNYFIEEYAENTTDYGYDRMAYIELERGCPFKCDFCSYDKTRKSSTEIDIERYKKLVDHFYSLDIDELYLLSPTLNRNKKKFHEYMYHIMGRREVTGKDIKLFGELRPELISDEDILLMRRAGFNCVEFGVQSMNLIYGDNLKKYDLKGFVGKLLSSGITPIVDFIIGFPGETSGDIRCTIDHLSDNGIIGYCNFYHLQVLHNTEIKKMFLSKGYLFQDKPPYLMLKNDSIDLQGIKDVYMYLEGEKDLSYREDFFIEEEEKFHLLRDQDDFKSLFYSPFYHSASFIFADNFVFDDIITSYVRFFFENPEVFHQIYLYSKDPIDPAEIRKLTDAIYPYSNYYDRYREGINYFNDELFSKTIHVMLKPGFSSGYIESVMDDYETGFVFFPGEKALFESSMNLISNYFDEYDIGSYVFGDYDVAGLEFVRKFPVERK